jgi:hypothetical protein
MFVHYLDKEERESGATPFLPISIVYDTRRLENTQIMYGNKTYAENVWVKFSET